MILAAYVTVSLFELSECPKNYLQSHLHHHDKRFSLVKNSPSLQTVNANTIAAAWPNAFDVESLFGRVIVLSKLLIIKL